MCNVTFIFNKRLDQLLTDIHILWKYATEITIVDKGKFDWEKPRGRVVEKKTKRGCKRGL